MLYRYLPVIILLVVSLHAVAEPVHSGGKAKEEYDNFRRQAQQSYEKFRNSALGEYADFLNAAWKEYKVFKGEVRGTKPKPVAPPDVKTTPVLPPADEMPVVIMPQDIVPPSVPVKPSVPIAPLVPQEALLSFYGATLKVPRMECSVISEMKPQEVAAAWRWYEEHGIKKVAETLKAIAYEAGLNDWFTYVMVRECVNAQCSSFNAASRVALQHFLLVNMGFDVRIADCGGAPCLLFATQQKVYARGYLQIDGRNYYIYQDDGSNAPEGGSLYTCRLPENVDLGNAMNMLLLGNMGMAVGEKCHRVLEYDGITVTADVDVRQMEMLRHYPQMSVPCYAMSEINPQLRKSVLEQLRPYVAGLSETDAANRLLHFVQYAFDYATDGEQHGYEKSYFFEENFFYPKNDCEDRAIFYAYLVRNLLGLDVHLVQFPGHECTAVCFSEELTGGTGYVYKDRTFIICDPTYIGASIGQCMPEYQGVMPEIEVWY